MEKWAVILLFAAFWICTEATLDCLGSYECLPGANELAVGFDIVKGTSFTNPNNQIFDLTLTDSPEKWINPASQKSYYYPSIMKFAYNEKFDMETYLHRNASSYANQLTHQVGASLGYCRFGGCFKESDEVNIAQKQFMDKQTVMVTEVDSDVYYSVGVDPTSLFSNFSSEFQASVANLTGNFLNPSYASFVSKFGTHWVSQVDVGGRAIFTYYGKNQYSKNATDVTVSANAQLSFLHMKLGSCGVSASANFTDQFSESIKQQSVSSLVGGNIGISTKEANWFSQWLSSVYKTPVTIQSYVNPITTLIEDAEKRDTLGQYIEYYINSVSFTDYNSATYPIPLTSCSTSGVGLYNQVGVYYHDDDADDDYNYNIIEGIYSINNFMPCYSFFYSETYKYPVENDFIKIVPLPETKPENPFNKYTTQEVESSDEYLGGVDSMGISIDLLTGKKKVQQVVNFSFNNQNTWKNPYTNISYLYPDQMSISSIDKTNRKTNVFSSAYNYAEQISQSIDSSFSIPLLSLSHDVYSSNSIFFGSQSVMGIVKEQYILYQAYLKEDQLSVTANFQSAVDNLLTETYDADVYGNFVSLFGTAVITSAQFGGEALMRTIIDQNYYSLYSVTSIENSLGVTFDNWNAGLEYGTSSSSSELDFSTSSLSLLQFHGGSFGTTSYANWQDWVDSIPAYPFQLSFTTKNITYFISDSTKKANMAKFLEEYYLMSKIEKQNVVQTKVKLYTDDVVRFPNCPANYAVSYFENAEYVSGIEIGTDTYYRYNSPMVCGGPMWSKSSFGTTPIYTIDCVNVVRMGVKQSAYLQCPDGYFLTSFSESVYNSDTGLSSYDAIYKAYDFNTENNVCCKFGYNPN